MNRQEYANYETRFSSGMIGIEAFSSGSLMQQCGYCPPDANYDDGICYDAEPFFSWQPCDICASSLGGDRESSHAYCDGELVHLSVCVDCVYYAEYGRLDDRTMLEIEESQ